MRTSEERRDTYTCCRIFVVLILLINSFQQTAAVQDKAKDILLLYQQVKLVHVQQYCCRYFIHTLVQYKDENPKIFPTRNSLVPYSCCSLQYLIPGSPVHCLLRIIPGTAAQARCACDPFFSETTKIKIKITKVRVRR